MGKASLLLKNGIVYDGTGSGPFTADIVISGDTVELIGRGGSSDRRQQRPANVIDLGGLAVSPGFIDVHSHSGFSVLREPPEAKILQGVTTEINGNCGLSAAPLYGDTLKQREKDLEGIDERWTTFDEYFRVLESRGLSINFATLAGHGNIRASVMGYEDGRPGQNQMEAMKGLLKESLESGAIGLSTGLIYPPGIYADTEELIELAGYGGKISENFIYTSHIRSEGQKLIGALEEAVRTGRDAGVKLNISHIKTAGRHNWTKIDDAISILNRARNEGVAVTCDRYPYIASSTGLDAVLPAWVFRGGNEEALKRLKEAGEKIKKEITRDDDYWKSVCVSTVTLKKNRWMEGKSIGEIAGHMGGSPVDALIDVLVQEELRVEGIFYSMSEDNLKRFLSLPYTMVGSDSAARSMKATGKPHPRTFGTFSRFLGRYAGDLGAALYKITVLPALTFGLQRRGRIKEGFIADMVVFDPDEIIDTATFDNPVLKPRGIHHVIVNGVPVLSGGALTGARPGRVLRHGR